MDEKHFFPSFIKINLFCTKVIGRIQLLRKFPFVFTVVITGDSFWTLICGPVHQFNKFFILTNFLILKIFKFYPKFKFFQLQFLTAIKLNCKSMHTA